MRRASVRGLAQVLALLLIGLVALASGAQAQTESGTEAATSPGKVLDTDGLTHLERLVEMDTTDLTAAQRAVIDDWLATAQRAEEAIRAGRASNAALEALRDEIAGFRRQFEQARTENAARIDTLQSQLGALGPAPENPEDEAAEIAVLRSGLTQRIRQLRVPVVIANEAYSRADGIIAEIDRIIRDRQTRRLLSRTVTPLDPTTWLPAWRSVASAARDVMNESRIAWSNRLEMKQLESALPQVLLLSAIGLVFLVLGRRWATRLGNWARGFGGRGSGIWSTMISLGRIGLPLFGVWLMTRAAAVSGVLGLRGELIAEAIPFWALTVLGFLWLGERLYPRHETRTGAGIAEGHRGRARSAMLAFGVVFVLHDMLLLLERIETLSEGSRAALGFPIVLLGAGALWWLRRIGLDSERTLAADEDGTTSGRGGLQRIGPVIRQAALAVALATPLLAAVGYGALAEAVLYPFILTLAVLGVVIALQRILGDIYIWALKLDDSEDLLLPAVLGLVLMILSLPVLALIWGMRTSELLELWQRFLQGVQIGDTRISPVDFLTFAVVFVIGYTVTRMVQSTLRTNLLPKTSLDLGGQTAVVSGVGYVGIFLAALIAVSTAGIDLSSLAIVAGALSVGIGFGLQTIVSNFVSGIILLIERPVAEGDWIEVGGFQGYVRDISVRATRIETFDRQDVIVPNSELVSGAVVNYTRGNTIGRLILPVGVAYGTDTGKVEAILREIAQAHPMVLANPAPNIVFRGFGADSLDFEIRAILRDVNWVLSVRSEMNHQINARFVEEGIEIPFAQRDVWLRNAEALHRPEAGTQTPPQPAGPVPPELQDRHPASEDDDG